MVAAKQALQFEVVQSRNCPGEWRAEAVDPETDGLVYLALFSGQGAEDRAREYATAKNETAEGRAVKRLWEAFPALRVDEIADHGKVAGVVDPERLDAHLWALALHFYRGGVAHGAAGRSSDDRN